jgi:hypothetical protein
MTTTKKRIRVTYEIITPESAVDGDVAESGWLDEEGRDFHLPLRPSSGPEDTAVAYAIDHLSAEGATSDGGSEWVTAYGDMDPSDGSYTNTSFHFVEGEWTDKEIDEIHTALS